MIENQNQYLVTEIQVKNFEKALSQLDTAIGFIRSYYRPNAMVYKVYWMGCVMR